MPNEKKRRILWVDDEPRCIDACVFYLVEVLNVEVDLYSTVESAIYQLQTNCYDLIITDLMMPLEISLEIPYEDTYQAGAFLIKEIRSGIWDNENNNFALSKTPIILWTNAYHEIEFERIEKILVINKAEFLLDEFSEIVRSVFV